VTHDATAAPTPPRILVVEDHFAVADSLRMLLVNEGFEVVGMAGTLAAASALVERGGFDVAILDIRLGNTNVTPVALRVAELGIPLLFLTGYGETDVLPASLRSYPRLTKPCDPTELLALLRRVASKPQS
jgi:DNA-binding response OmpR family regulator